MLSVATSLIVNHRARALNPSHPTHGTPLIDCSWLHNTSGDILLLRLRQWSGFAKLLCASALTRAWLPFSRVWHQASEAPTFWRLVAYACHRCLPKPPKQCGYNQAIKHLPTTQDFLKNLPSVLRGRQCCAGLHMHLISVFETHASVISH